MRGRTYVTYVTACLGAWKDKTWYSQRRSHFNFCANICITATGDLQGMKFGRSAGENDSSWQLRLHTKARGGVFAHSEAVHINLAK